MLHRQQQRDREAATLLRPSETSNNALLRPAQSVASSPDLLLRAEPSTEQQLFNPGTASSDESVEATTVRP
jgi:hypothetical protein